MVPDVLALDHLQVMSDTRHQEDIRQAGVDAAVGRGIRGVIQCRFLGGVSREEARIISIFIVT